MALSLRSILIISNNLRNRHGFSNRTQNLERDITSLSITKIINYWYPTDSIEKKLKKKVFKPEEKTTFKVKVKTNPKYPHKHPVSQGGLSFPENHLHSVEINVESLSVDAPVKVHCNCPDFHYRFAYPLVIRNAFFGTKRKGNTTPTKKTNPKYYPAVCKHILAVVRVLIRMKQLEKISYSEWLHRYNRSTILKKL